MKFLSTSCALSTQFSPSQLQSVKDKFHENGYGFATHLPRLDLKLQSLPPCSGCAGAAARSVELNPLKRSNFRVCAIKGSEQFRGKPGSVSFGGLSHQSVEETKIVSSPFTEKGGSLLWILAPSALISGLVIPQFFVVGAIEDYFRNELFAEILASLSTEIIFYAGLAAFLFITERIQKPYLEFSSKRWSLITGLKGYLSSAFLIMGIKVLAPLVAVYVTWPVIGFSAMVSVAPFLIGCFAQFLFEISLDRRGSSCWPVLPIIFEVYRIYQLTRATVFMEKLIYGMRDASVSRAVVDRTGALVSMIVMFRILGIVCLWSLLTFLLRLFPSRPVAENY